jgi:hypothetical protein
MGEVACSGPALPKLDTVTDSNGQYEVMAMNLPQDLSHKLYVYGYEPVILDCSQLHTDSDNVVDFERTNRK